MADWVNGIVEALALLFFIGSMFLVSHIAALGVA
jgi:hypothetical protein